MHTHIQAVCVCVLADSRREWQRKVYVAFAWIANKNKYEYIRATNSIHQIQNDCSLSLSSDECRFDGQKSNGKTDRQRLFCNNRPHVKDMANEKTESEREREKE